MVIVTEKYAKEKLEKQTFLNTMLIIHLIIFLSKNLLFVL